MPQIIHVLQVLALLAGLITALTDHRDDFTGSLSKRTLGLIFSSPFFVAIAVSLRSPEIGAGLMVCVLLVFLMVVSQALTRS